jgi:hypothetical protein
MDPVRDRIDERLLRPTRAPLGPAGSDAAARRGARLIFDEALAYALAGAR